MATKWQRFKVDLSDFNLPKSKREEVGDLIIERIVNRTDQGIDVDGEKFTNYSKSYLKSLDFKNAGKSASKIDLQLSGDMLAALKILKDEKGLLTIGFEKGTVENAKADGNIRGTYGQPRPNPFNARDFLGISDSELSEIIKVIAKGLPKGGAL